MLFKKGFTAGAYDANAPKLERDMVNHPQHYKLANGLESVDVINAMLTPEEYQGWLKGNALKYQFRAGKKNPEKLVEDYQKAVWYLKRLIEELGGYVDG